MATTPGLMTVEDLYALPELRAGRHELHHGELIIVPPPMSRHHKIQNKLSRLPLRVAEQAFDVSTECPFRPLAHNEYWIADVAAVALERWNAIPADDILRGSPELVIEVLSPSNTASEILDKQQTCFQGGCREFWVVDPERSTVTVVSPDAPGRWYGRGASIPLTLLGGGSLAVDDVFNV